MAVGTALLLVVAVVAFCAVAYAQTGSGVEPTQPEAVPPVCAGGVVLSNLEVGEYTRGIPGLDGEEVWISVDDPDGWWLEFESDIPVARVTVVGDAEGAPCNVYSYGTEVLTYDDYGLHAPGYERPTRIEICFAGGQILVHKFEDLDRDGAYDQGEPMLSGWHFSLVANSEGPRPVHDATTGAGGTLLFPNLEPGPEHIVTETLASGWVSTTGVQRDGIVVEGGEVTDVWFGNARDTVAPPADEEEEEEEEELLPKTGVDPTPLVGAVTALAAAAAAGLATTRRRRQSL